MRKNSLALSIIFLIHQYFESEMQALDVIDHLLRYVTKPPEKALKNVARLLYYSTK